MSRPAKKPKRFGARSRRIGVFGGTFNPIHLAHLRCAEEAREVLGLDQVLFVPTATPPHKSDGHVIESRHRLAMVRAALAGNPAFAVSSVEIERTGRSYSVDTLRILRRRLGPSSQLVFLMGADAFREIGTWKEFRTIFRLADVAVISRPNFALHRPRATLPIAVRSEFCYEPGGKALLHTSGNRIRFLHLTALDISASAIRQRLARGQSIRYLVPSGVERYIQRRKLYRQGNDRL